MMDYRRQKTVRPVKILAKLNNKELLLELSMIVLSVAFGALCAYVATS
jgi:hypothetical protein